jgi:hypothetical protein
MAQFVQNHRPKDNAHERHAPGRVDVRERTSLTESGEEHKQQERKVDSDFDPKYVTGRNRPGAHWCL